VVKQFMGFLLLATAVYFASPLIRSVASQETVWWVIFAALAAGSLFLLVRGVMVSKTMVGRVVAVVVAVLILVPSTYGVRLLTAGYPPGATTPVQLTGICERAALKQVLEDASKNAIAAVR